MRLTKGQCGAMFGLLLAGDSLKSIARILGTDRVTMRGYLPEDWVPPSHVWRQRPPAGDPANRPKRPYVRDPDARPRGRPALSLEQFRERHKAIIEAYGSGGRPIRELAPMFGVTYQRIQQVLARAQVEISPPGLPQEIHQDRFDKYEAALLSGISKKEARQVAGLTGAQIAHTRHCLGVKPPPDIRRMQRAEKIAAYYEANTSLTGREVAAHFGVPQVEVSRSLQLVGVPARKSWSWRKTREAQTQATA